MSDYNLDAALCEGRIKPHYDWCQKPALPGCLYCLEHAHERIWQLQNELSQLLDAVRDKDDVASD